MEINHVFVLQTKDNKNDFILTGVFKNIDAAKKFVDCNHWIGDENLCYGKVNDRINYVICKEKVI